MDNFSPDNLPISDDLPIDIIKWSDRWDSTYKEESPQESIFATLEEEVDFQCQFDLEGRRIWNELKKQLVLKYEISYRSKITGVLHR